MKTTVIIPTYNRADTLGAAIRSLSRQREEVDLDILVIDDGSTDGTSELLAEIQARHDCIRVVTKANAGVTKARNAGLENLHPETRFVSFLDSDDLSPKNRFTKDLHVLKDKPEIGMVYGKMLVVDRLDLEKLEPAMGAMVHEIVGIHLSAAIFRREFIERIGQFDEELLQAEDTDFLLRSFEDGTPFEQTDTITMYYLRHSGNMSGDLRTTRRYFAKAIAKSITRRRKNPDRGLRTPPFSVSQWQIFIE
jgi:glycosyltransferase involved in cell wall biosynthesis